MRWRINILGVALVVAGLGGCETTDLALKSGAEMAVKASSAEPISADHASANEAAEALDQRTDLSGKSQTFTHPALYNGSEKLAAKLPRRMGRREIKVGIFGFDEINLGRSEFFKKWSGALRRHTENQVTQTLLCAKGVISLCKTSTTSRFDSSLLSLRQTDRHLPSVNHHVNKVSYIEDSANYEQQDYWAAPREFFGKGGDCEDYAITKYLLLRELGIDPDSMRIVVVMDAQRDTAHAVLAVYLPDDILVLDNLSRSIARHQYVSNYIPIYSVNEKHAWLHTRNKAR